VDVYRLTQHFSIFQNRLAVLFEGATTSLDLSPELLPLALKELGIASEELQVTLEELCRLNEELVAVQLKLEAQVKHYRELFEFLPSAYLVTDVQGNILETNQTTAQILKIPQRFLVGKPLVVFICEQEHRAFYYQLSKLSNYAWVQEWEVNLRPRLGKPIKAALTVAPVRSPDGKLISLRWMLRELTEPQTSLKKLETENDDFSQNRPQHFYSKGETISLEPQAMWLVHQGLVKLSTINQSGKEVLVGLVGQSMSFGSSMTSLDIYQATVLSKTAQLIRFSLQEIEASPVLTKTLLAQINQRLRQTESLLAISGKPQVKDRLYSFLLLLKEEIGQVVGQSTRLSVRLTHQELAEACCTTRVTVTRELNKLKQQGKIIYDSQQHIVFTEKFAP